MIHRILSLVVIVAACAGVATPARSLVIDRFETAQAVSGAAEDGLPNRSTVTGAMLGGEREMVVGGPLPENAVTGVVEGGSLSLARSSEGQHFVDLLWSTDGIDLTAGGEDNAFQLDVAAFTNVTSVILSVSTDTFSQFNSRTIQTLTATGRLEFPFSEFRRIHSPEPADFANIRLIALRIHSTGEATFDGAFRTVPEPATALHLLVGLALLSKATAVSRQAHKKVAA